MLITGPPRCDQCRLDMTLVVELRDRPELGRQIVASNQAVVRDSGGRIFLVNGMNGSQIQLFDAGGDFIRSVGSQGQGPGEFSYIWAMALDREENLYAFDRERMTVLSPTFEVLDSRRLPFRVWRALFTDAGLVLVARSVAEGEAPLPLHLVTSDLRIVSSFGRWPMDSSAATGATREAGSGDHEEAWFRNIAGAADGRIWSSRVNRYLIEEWQPDTGERGRVFERAVEWFEPWLQSTSVSFETPPQPRLTAVWQDEQGLLWTLTSVAAEDWGEGLTMLSGYNDTWIEYPEKVYDAYIEVIDPDTGSLLLSERVPQALGGVTNDGLAIGRRYPEGEPYQIDLWKLRLVR
jgi:hypothetical protein